METKVQELVVGAYVANGILIALTLFAMLALQECNNERAAKELDTIRYMQSNPTQITVTCEPKPIPEALKPEAEKDKVP